MDRKKEYEQSGKLPWIYRSYSKYKKFVKNNRAGEKPTREAYRTERRAYRDNEDAVSQRESAWAGVAGRYGNVYETLPEVVKDGSSKAHEPYVSEVEMGYRKPTGKVWDAIDDYIAGERAWYEGKMAQQGKAGKVFYEYMHPVTSTYGMLLDAYDTWRNSGDASGFLLAAAAAPGGEAAVVEKAAGKGRKLYEAGKDFVKSRVLGYNPEKYTAVDGGKTIFGDEVAKGVFVRNGEGRFYKTGPKHNERNAFMRWVQNDGQASYVYIPADKIKGKPTVMRPEFVKKDNKAFKKSVEAGYGKAAAESAKPENWYRVNLADIAKEDAALFNEALDETMGGGTVKDAVLRQIKWRNGNMVPYNPNDMKAYGFVRNYHGYEGIPVMKKVAGLTVGPATLYYGIPKAVEGSVNGVQFWNMRSQDNEAAERMNTDEMAAARMKYRNSKELDADFKSGFANVMSNFRDTFRENPDAVSDMVNYLYGFADMSEDEQDKAVADLMKKYEAYDSQGNPTQEYRDVVNVLMAVADLERRGVLSRKEIALMTGSEMDKYLYRMNGSPYEYKSAGKYLGERWRKWRNIPEKQ